MTSPTDDSWADDETASMVFVSRPSTPSVTVIGDDDGAPTMCAAGLRAGATPTDISMTPAAIALRHLERLRDTARAYMELQSKLSFHPDGTLIFSFDNEPITEHMEYLHQRAITENSELPDPTRIPGTLTKLDLEVLGGEWETQPLGPDETEVRRGQGYFSESHKMDRLLRCCLAVETYGMDLAACRTRLGAFQTKLADTADLEDFPGGSLSDSLYDAPAGFAEGDAFTADRLRLWEKERSALEVNDANADRQRSFDMEEAFNARLKERLLEATKLADSLGLRVRMGRGLARKLAHTYSHCDYKTMKPIQLSAKEASLGSAFPANSYNDDRKREAEDKDAERLLKIWQGISIVEYCGLGKTNSPVCLRSLHEVPRARPRTST